jgi:uncharacterized protein (TIGR02594 family)
MATSLKIYNAALQYLGTKEAPGAATNAKIAKWITVAAAWLEKDDSKTAWCGCFRGAIGIETATGCPPDHYRAASWATWGTPIDITKPLLWQRGDTLIMTRPGGNHVCLLDRVDSATAYCLGGNQSDAVTIAPFPLTRITHVRRI